MSYKIFEYDPALKAFESDINLRMNNYYNKKRELVGDNGKLIDFANGHHYFGFHKVQDGQKPLSCPLYILSNDHLSY